jgi:hypothetical protein
VTRATAGAKPGAPPILTLFGFFDENRLVQ